MEEGVHASASALTAQRLTCNERGAHAARTIRRHAPSGRRCGDKIRRMTGTLEIRKSTAAAVFRRKYIIRSMFERHGPSGECPRCETGQGSHFERCRLRFEKAKVHETELTQAERPRTTTTLRGQDSHRRLMCQCMPLALTWRNQMTARSR